MNRDSVRHWDGNAWTYVPTCTLGGFDITGSLRQIRTFGPRDVWISGNNGILIHHAP